MAQPELPKLLGRLLDQSLKPGVTVMIAPDQLQRRTGELWQASQHVSQPGRDTLTGVNEIAQHDKALWPPSMAEVQQGIQSAAISIAGEGDAMGLKRFGLAKVQISNE